jgi:hypothetical protein
MIQHEERVKPWELRIGLEFSEQPYYGSIFFEIVT